MGVFEWLLQLLLLSTAGERVAGDFNHSKRLSYYYHICSLQPLIQPLITIHVVSDVSKTLEEHNHHRRHDQWLLVCLASSPTRILSGAPLPRTLLRFPASWQGWDSDPSGGLERRRRRANCWWLWALHSYKSICGLRGGVDGLVLGPASLTNLASVQNRSGVRSKDSHRESLLVV